MLKSLTPAVIFMFWSGIGMADAAYLIKLKNGNEYVTTRYWHQGSQVLFDTYGGIFGIEKSFIHKIETNHVGRLATVSERDQPEKPQMESPKDSNRSIEKKSGEQAPVKNEKPADDPIVGEFNRLRTKSQEVDGMLTGEIRELLNQITAFKKKISKDSKLFIEYGREFNEVQELGGTLESALRSRTQ